jgi:4-hydroxy-3-polyprenylbenzoate decarboxylase
MGIDAARKWAAEGFSRPWPQMLTQDPAIKSKIDAM